MAILMLNIQQTDETDFDGNPEPVKLVACSIDGGALPRRFSYPAATADADITADVRAKLTADGYEFN